MAAPKRLIVGCGYVGGRVAECWHNQGNRVFAVTRSEANAAVFRARGWEPIVWDWSDASSAPELLGQGFETVLIAVSHAVPAGVAPQETHVRGLEHLHRALGKRSSLARWLYVSTTGVYGSVHHGLEVNESTPAAPTRPGSIAAWHAEQWLADNITSVHRVVFRPSGIYGPGRFPNVQAIRDQKPIAVDPESLLNLIHVDDLVSVINHASLHAMRFPLYCVSDGHSPTRREYYQFLADLLHASPPVFDTLQTPKPRSEGSKQVSPQRLLEELPFSFRYPDFRAGLQGLLPKMISP